MPSGLSFLMNVDKDMVATYAFLDMMMHFLHACQLRVAKYAFADQLSNAVPTQTLNGQYQQGDLRAADNFPCTVRIAQRHGRGTRIVRMNCPSIDVIAVYCPEMAVRLSV